MAGQQDSAHSGIRAQRREGAGEFEDGRGVEGIVLLGPVQRDAGEAARVCCDLQHGHIRNRPKRVSGTGAFSAAARLSAITVRVSSGAMMPSSHRRALAK